jgi:hypothetical protein
MSNLSIVGGIYIERCIQPIWNAVYGSAGRAAQSIAPLISGQITLNSYVAEGLLSYAEYLASDCGAMLVAEPARHAVSFDYLHPLSTPIIRPSPDRMVAHDPIRVAGDIVLRYGMLEGDAIVQARIAVYDPQSAFGASHFIGNGSHADHLAIVMNRVEAQSMTGIADAHVAAKSLVDTGKADVVIIKMGCCLPGYGYPPRDHPSKLRLARFREHDRAAAEQFRARTRMVALSKPANFDARGHGCLEAGRDASDDRRAANGR